MPMEVLITSALLSCTFQPSEKIMPQLTIEDVELIEEDLSILESMSYAFEAYLNYVGLFYPLETAGYPRLSLGGLLLRKNRLAEIQEQLPAELRVRFKKVDMVIEETIANHIAAVESKANSELEMRVQQWEMANKDAVDNGEDSEFWYNNYEVRTIIHCLILFLQKQPFHLDLSLLEEASATDALWQQRWQQGPFVWEPVWQGVYPRDRYWWLYSKLG